MLCRLTAMFQVIRLRSVKVTTKEMTEVGSWRGGWRVRPTPELGPVKPRAQLRMPYTRFSHPIASARYLGTKRKSNTTNTWATIRRRSVLSRQSKARLAR